MPPHDVARVHRVSYCQSLMLPRELGTIRHPHKHPHNFCLDLRFSGVFMGIPARSLVPAQGHILRGRNDLADKHDDRRPPLISGRRVLITQRSKVQILPPQPTHSSVATPNSPFPEASTKFIPLLLSAIFEKAGLVTARWVFSGAPKKSITDRRISLLRLSAKSVVTKIVTNSGRESFFAACSAYRSR
jgi:hypothetical protein